MSSFLIYILRRRMEYKINQKNQIRYRNDVALGIYNLQYSENILLMKDENENEVWQLSFSEQIQQCEQILGNFNSISEQIKVILTSGRTLVYSTMGTLLFDSYTFTSDLNYYLEELKGTIKFSQNVLPGLYHITCDVEGFQQQYELFDSRGMCIFVGNEKKIEFKILVLENEVLQIKTRDAIDVLNVKINSLSEEAVIHVIGDSTLANQDLPLWSWPQLLQAKLNVPVINLAISARSTKSFTAEGRHKYLFKNMNAGDILIIGFGHNDEKTTYFGTGLEEFIENINEFICECKIRQVTPIVVTPIARRNFVDGKLVETHEPYLSALKNNFSNILIDNNQYTTDLINQLGEEGSKQIFIHSDLMKVYDNTHTSHYGANLICDYFIENMKNKSIIIHSIS